MKNNMKNILIALLLIVNVAIINTGCKKSNNDPQPSNVVNNPGGGTDTITDKQPKCGDLALSITYKGNIHSATLENGLFFLNNEIQLPFEFTSCSSDGANWLHDSIYTHSSNSHKSPVITKTYLNTWGSLPKKFEVGMTNDNPSTETKYTFYITINGQRPYYEGEAVKVTNPSDPGGSPLILGNASTYNSNEYSSYLEIESMVLDTRKYDDTHTINEYSKEVNNQETYIVTGNFRVIRLVNNEVVTGTFKTQMLVQL